ncbi:hypothetical protein WJX84_006097 [Apatococcus fuscideae]|uniref:Uncharacterized protein n=1 Tax=Apatococcus fuscideae TaxID=2026836 RepID=A0AAW1RK53_9CHLO
MEHHLSPTLQPLRGTNRHGASSAPAGKAWSIVGGGSATGAVPERLPSGEVSTPSAASEDCAIEVPSIHEALRMPGHARMHASELAAVPQSPLSTPSSRLAPSLSADRAGTTCQSPSTWRWSACDEQGRRLMMPANTVSPPERLGHSRQKFAAAHVGYAIS